MPKNMFLNEINLSEEQLKAYVAEATQGASDGDLFFEDSQSQSLSLEEGQVKKTSYNESRGMGLRRIEGEFSALTHSANLTEEQLQKAVADVNSVSQGESTIKELSAPKEGNKLYDAFNPIDDYSLEERIDLLHNIDSYIRKKENKIQQVIVNMSNSYQSIMVVGANGKISTDVRPIVNLSMSVILEKGGLMESGSHIFGGRYSNNNLFDTEAWQHGAEEAIRQANVKLEAISAPAGEMPVVLAPGWSGVLFHEAVGHGLEADFNRKGTSAFSGLVGESVAAKGVTIIDDGSISQRRGSLHIDDEGTPTQRNILIENGILKGYMQDRMNARLMGMPLTGNGRREGYNCNPMPRMTNTFLAPGEDDVAQMLADTPNGLYAKTFGGGLVDITSGNFVFDVTEAYLIENGKVTKPVKGATLTGNGPNVLKFIDRIGPDLAMDNGAGMCGKSGQNVPVGVGQPSMRLSNGITVGGTS